MCRSIAAGGRRCTSSHPAVRSAARAASAQLGHDVAAAGPGHPAATAYTQAQTWAQRTREAAERGDEGKAAQYAEHARQCAQASRTLLARPGDVAKRPDPTDPRYAYALAPAPAAGDRAGHIPAPARLPEFPEHVRAASKLAEASGAGAGAKFVPREDGGQSVAWGEPGYCGVATVYAGDDDKHPHARLSFSSLDRDRYEALAASPWPYRVQDDGSVLYDRVPVDQAEQILHTARTGQVGKPWERHGLPGREDRDELPSYEATKLVGESRAWAGRLDEEERRWITNYTGDGYYQHINEHLYSGRSLDEDLWIKEQVVSVRSATSTLDAALAKAGGSGTLHTTYRGFTPPSDVRERDQVDTWVRANFQVGQDYRDDSYMSVSHCPATAAGFSQRFWQNPETKKHGNARHRVVFEVVSSRGAAVAAVGVQGNEERERLMPRGSSYRVVGIQQDVEVDGHNCMVVQMVDTKDIPRP
ncbi:ADP-ribosyltransferase [Streptomyces californicus]|uniref:ADP-ribosyltransferase n=1 Tax=Streptomyces californicus TaxID=67351 RepID=UPI0037A8370B